MDLLGHIKDPLGHKSSKKAKKKHKRKSSIEEVKSIKYTAKIYEVNKINDYLQQHANANWH